VRECKKEEYMNTSTALQPPSFADTYRSIVFYGKWAIYGVVGFFAFIFIWFLLQMIFSSASFFWQMSSEALGGFVTFLGFLEENPWLVWLGIGLAAFVPLAGYSYQAYGWVKGKIKDYLKTDVQKQPKEVQKWLLRRTRYEARMYEFDEQRQKLKKGTAEYNRVLTKETAYKSEWTKKWDKAKLDPKQRTYIEKKSQRPIKPKMAGDDEEGLE